MSRRTKRGLLGAGAVVGILCALGVTLRLRSAATQDAVPNVPRLFALSYAEGHELAGFSGRPMVLVFGDTKSGDWSKFLLDCEQDAKLAGYLSSTFQGVFVDVGAEIQAAQTYGSPKPGTVLVKDLSGPIRGILHEEYTCTDLVRILEEALPYISIQKSPAYLRLLAGTDLLDELVQKSSVFDDAGGKEEALRLKEEASRIVRLFERFESGSSKAFDAQARALELGLQVAK